MSYYNMFEYFVTKKPSYMVQDSRYDNIGQLTPCDLVTLLVANDESLWYQLKLNADPNIVFWIKQEYVDVRQNPFISINPFAPCNPFPDYPKKYDHWRTIGPSTPMPWQTDIRYIGDNKTIADTVYRSPAPNTNVIMGNKLVESKGVVIPDDGTINN